MRTRGLGAAIAIVILIFALLFGSLQCMKIRVVVMDKVGNETNAIENAPDMPSVPEHNPSISLQELHEAIQENKDAQEDFEETLQRLNREIEDRNVESP